MLTTAGWVLWSLMLAAGLCGVWNELVTRPRRERRMADLIEIVTDPSCGWWVPNDWIET